MDIPAPHRAIADRIRRAERAVRNAGALATSGEAPVGQTPRDLAWRDGRASLWRYGHGATGGRPVFIVHSLVSRAFILDLMPGNSFVSMMLEAGLQPYLLEFGEPDARDADNDLGTYADRYIPAAAEVVHDLSGDDEISMLGYCYGGTLLQLALANPANGMRPRGFATMATPVDWHRMGLLVDVMLGDHLEVQDLLDPTGNIPFENIERGFSTLQPTNRLAAWADLIANLDDAQWLQGYRAMKAWIEDQVPFPGAAMVQSVDRLIRPNALLGDGADINGTRRRLTDITCPVLVVAGQQDVIVPVESALPEGLEYGGPTTILHPDVSHVGLVAGRKASKVTVPSIIEWLADPATAVVA